MFYIKNRIIVYCQIKTRAYSPIILEHKTNTSKPCNYWKIVIDG